MTVALEGNAKRTLDGVKAQMDTMSKKHRRRNISGLSAAELEGDIDYILHVDHELPMEWYTGLDAAKSDMAHLIVTHADAAVRRFAMEMLYNVAKELEDNIGNAILHMPGFSEPYDTEQVGVQDGVQVEPSMKDLLA